MREVTVESREVDELRDEIARLRQTIARLEDKVIDLDRLAHQEHAERTDQERQEQPEHGLTQVLHPHVDTLVAPVAHKVTPPQLDRVVNEAIGEVVLPRWRIRERAAPTGAPSRR